MMNEHGKSDSPIVPRNSPNNISKETEEVMEGRGLAKGNPPKHTTPRTQGRISVPNALERVGQAAKKDRRQRFTALLYHVYDVERLRAAYYALKHGAAPGIDGETWEHYGKNLEENLHHLSVDGDVGSKMT